MAPPSTDRPLRLCLIGCGRIADSHLRAIAAVEDAALAAVVEVREAAGRAIAERWRCPYVPAFDDPALQDLCDAVLIATPPASHFAIARHFLRQGIPVLCEKPLTFSPADAETLVELGEQHGALLMMASKFRYAQDLVEAKAIVESGVLGKVVLYENAFCSVVPMAGRWNADPTVAGGGVLIDNGTHSADIARYLLGPITAVQAQLGQNLQALPVEDTVRLQLRTASGVLGNVDLSWSLPAAADTFVRVHGADGTLQVGWSGSRYRRATAPWIPFGTGYDKTAALERQLRNFVATLRGTEPPLITPAAALASVRVIDTAYRSVEEARWLLVP